MRVRNAYIFYTYCSSKNSCVAVLLFMWLFINGFKNTKQIVDIIFTNNNGEVAKCRKAGRRTKKCRKLSM